jgi:hypothetical protein
VAWSQQPRLFATDGETGDKFGAPVAISGDTLLIGAPFDDVGGNTNQGSASVFAICKGLAEQQKLTAANGAGSDYFGDAVAISGDTVVIGSFGDNIDGNIGQGSAYIFVLSGGTWTQQQKLTAVDGAAGDLFGLFVAISGDTVVVGAAYDTIGANASQGSAYIFVRSGATWTLQQKIIASDGAANDQFSKVALSGDTAVIGARLDDIGGGVNQGSAYVFVRSGATWTEQQKLSASDGAAGDSFGDSVAASGDTVIVGADGDDNGQGSAYVFVRSGATWTEQQKLTALDGVAGDLFGCSVAVSDATAVVGARSNGIGGNPFQGSAYVFERSGATWTEQQKLTALDGVANAFFGSSVAVSGDTAVVGAVYGDDSAYVFARGGTTWTQRQKLTASDGAEYKAFGESVAISGGTVVVGAGRDEIGGNMNQGSAYIFACASCPTITLDPAALPPGTAGSPYNWNVTATGGVEPYNYSVSSGTLPLGLTLDPTTGALSGAPPIVGTFNFRITAAGGGLCPGSRDYALVIACRTINVRPANPNLPPGEVGAAYNRVFTANGGLAPYGFSISAGALPGGLTLDAATGALSGRPSASGTFNFAIQAADSSGCAGVTAYVLTINCPAIQVNPNLPNGALGTAYNQTVAATGGAGPYTFDVAAGALPDGLALNASTGALSGTPAARGAFNFVIRATDRNGCAGRRPYQIAVN